MSDNDVLAYRPKDAARRLSLSVAYCYRLIAEGQIRSVRIGSAIRVPASEIDRLIQPPVTSFERFTRRK